MNIQHSSRTDAWGTPRHIVEAVREVLGTIEFDPASDRFFNQTIGAAAYLTKREDGATASWPSDRTVFVNPPGGKTRNRSNTVLFWDRLMAYLEAGHLKHAVFLAFSLEALQSSQGARRSMLEFPLCVPRRRVAFVTPEGLPAAAPSHANVIVYVPGSINRTDAFLRVFSGVGKCVKPEVIE